MTFSPLRRAVSATNPSVYRPKNRPTETTTTSTCWPPEDSPGPCTGFCYAYDSVYTYSTLSNGCRRCLCTKRPLALTCSMQDHCISSSRCEYPRGTCTMTGWYTTKYESQDQECPSCSCHRPQCTLPATVCGGPCSGTGTLTYSTPQCALCPNCICSATVTWGGGKTVAVDTLATATATLREPQEWVPEDVRGSNKNFGRNYLPKET
jgi:hypothetical protein